ncbi:MAG: SMI1/KNR4 family protein [Planctomycetaceae bacterium]
MSVTWSKVGKALTADDIVSAERKLGLSIPQQFRDFLLTTNGGVPTPKKIPRHDFSVTSILSLAKVLRVAEQYWSEVNLPKHQLPIGWADQVDLLVMDGEKVIIHTNCEGGIGMFGAECEEVAASFDEFLAMLTTPKKTPPSNEKKFVNACENGKLEQVKKMIAAGVDWDFVAVPAFRAACCQMVDGMNDFTLLTMLFEGGAPSDVHGIFSNLCDEEMSVEEYLREHVLPGEQRALGLFKDDTPEQPTSLEADLLSAARAFGLFDEGKPGEGTLAGDQVRKAVAQLESILSKYFIS